MTGHQNKKPLKKTRPADLSRLLQQRLSEHVIGQPQAMEAIAPYVQMYEAGLCPEGRPAGVFLLLGPTGTGKTRTVEALAEVLHGSLKHVLRIDCGEFQMDHEVAKLIGAPPGYLGHRETHPVLTQARLASITSDRSGLSIVLFDEIEKAAPSLTRLLLGVLDKASLRLGDNNVVNFERSLIFMTSNVGASKMMKQLRPGFGFEANVGSGNVTYAQQMDRIVLEAAKREFSPEFLNRVDALVTYQPLSEPMLQEILDQQIELLQRHIEKRLGPNGFTLQVPKETRLFLLRIGASSEYGARELKRTVHKHLTHPLASLVASGTTRGRGVVRAELNPTRTAIRLRTAA